MHEHEPDTMQNQNTLLLAGLDLDKPHARPADGLANREAASPALQTAAGRTGTSRNRPLTILKQATAKSGRVSA
jgi:hypothetical protein